MHMGRTVVLCFFYDHGTYTNTGTRYFRKQKLGLQNIEDGLRYFEPFDCTIERLSHFTVREILRTDLRMY